MSVNGCPVLALAPDPALLKSAAIIRPPGPDPPPTEDKSRPCSDASRFANGDANNLPPTPPEAGLEGAGVDGNDAGAAGGDGGGLDLGGADVGADFTSIGPEGPT